MMKMQIFKTEDEANEFITSLPDNSECEIQEANDGFRVLYDPTDPFEDQIDTVVDEEETKEEVKEEKKQEKKAKTKLNPVHLAQAKRKAISFILTQYPHFKKLEEALEKVEVSQVSMLRNRLGSFKIDHKTKKRTIQLNSKQILNDERRYGFYSRASAHLMEPQDGTKLNIKMFDRLTLILVHEYTHAVQDYEGTRKNEVDTTRNEIEFMRLNLPDEYLKLVPSQHKPPYIRGQRVILEGDSTLWRIEKVRWRNMKRTWRYELVSEKDRNVTTRILEKDLVSQVVKFFKPKPKKKASKKK